MNAAGTTDYEYRRALSNLPAGEHFCLIYSDRDEEMGAISTILQAGLDRGERCIYVTDGHAVEDLRWALARERADLNAELAAGRLLLLSKESTFLSGGAFDPDYVLAFCRRAFLEGREAGFTSVRFFAEMTWLLEHAPGTEKFQVYGAQLNQLVAELRAIVVCGYNRTKFGSEDILRVLRTHPSVIYGRVVGRNPYYVPPEEYSAPNRSDLMVERLLSNLREREQVQIQMRERFVAFMDHLPAAVWIKDLQGRYLYLNVVAQRMPAYSAGWLSRRDDELWPAEIAQRFMANDQRVIALREAMQSVEPYVSHGETRYGLVTKFPIFDPQGRLILLGGTSVEITERVQMEQALRESEERFRQLAENIREIFWVQDATTGKLEYVSPAYEQIWKREVSELQFDSQAWMRSIHPEDRERVEREHDLAVLQRGHDHRYRVVWPDDTVRWVRDRAFPVVEPDGSIPRIVGLAEDITDAVLTQQALRDANDRLQQLTRRLYEVQERERQHFARELHDEVGGALTAAKINLKTALATADPSSAALLKETASILDGLLGQVREISLNLRPSMLDDLGLVPALRSLLDQQTRRAGLAFSFSASAVPEKLDPETQTACFRIAQEALTNILRHAQARAVQLELRITEGQLHLTVTDNGRGFVMDHTGRIKKKFGLVGIRERAELAGGKALVLSNPGTGTMVDVWLPLTGPGSKEEVTS